MSFGEPWAYSDSSNWKKTYPAAKGKEQSPINIDVSNISDCSSLCQISMKYAKSKCHARVQNKTPILTFDSGSYIKHVRDKKVLSLKAMTIHTPSLHTINGTQYDMEVVLYHKMGGNMETDGENYVPGGTAISILFQKGADFGKQNNFFHSFIHQLPADRDTKKEMDITVGKDWGPEMVIPELKSYFYYPGSLPFPPCEEGWDWIVFEEIQGISKSIIDTLKLAFNKNIRNPLPLNARIPSYNANVEMPVDPELEVKSIQDSKLISNEGTPKKEENLAIRDETQKMAVVQLEKGRIKDWYKENKLNFKSIMIAIILLMLLYSSLKIVKYIVSNDLLNKIMVRQALGLTQQESSSKS